jgi:hypothetical protein
VAHIQQYIRSRLTGSEGPHRSLPVSVGALPVCTGYSLTRIPVTTGYFRHDFTVYRSLPNHSLPVRCGIFTTILYGFDRIPVDTAERHSSNTSAHSVLTSPSTTLTYDTLDFMSHSHVHSAPTYDHAGQLACYPYPTTLFSGVASRCQL